MTQPPGLAAVVPWHRPGGGVAALRPADSLSVLIEPMP